MNSPIQIRPQAQPSAVGNTLGVSDSTQLQRLPSLESPSLMSSISQHESEAAEHLEQQLSEGISDPSSSTDALILDQADATSSHISTSDLHDALSPASPQKPYSFKDALDFRKTLSESGQTLASDMMMKLEASHGNSNDPQIKNRLNHTLLQLTDFKKQLSQSMEKDLVRAGELEKNLPPNANEKQRLKAIANLMGGCVKSPMSIKSLWKFSFKDNFRARSQLIGLKRAAKQGLTFEPPGPPIHLRAAMNAYLKGVMKQSGFDSPSSSDIKLGMTEHMAAHAEREQGWQAINNQIALQQTNGALAVFNNKITPAREFSQQVNASYEPGRKGVSCMNTTDAKNTVNLWKTEFAPTDGNGIQFSALRHGIHDAYDIKDAEQRNNASDAKVQQFIRSAVDAYPDKLQLNADGSYSIDIVSVSLVSPAAIGGEGKMWAQQRDAYARAQDNPIEMTVDRGDGSGPQLITVKPNILAFNTPVNSVALEKAALRPLLGGLDESHRANTQAIEQLIGNSPPGTVSLGGLAGKIQARLQAEIALGESQGKDMSAAQNRMMRINGLVAQIRQIMNAPTSSGMSYQRAGNEPYKLPTRLIALANELGIVGAFNCKSGKDRTGQLDAEIKDFYAHRQINGNWRDVNVERSAEQNKQLQQFVEEGGSFEIQKFNTSLPGSKVEASAIKKPLMAAMRSHLDPTLSKKEREALIPKEAFKGLSSWVGS